jgi:hypothetical protein
MRIVEAYEARDGVKFFVQRECERYEQELTTVEEFCSLNGLLLNPPLLDPNGENFFQLPSGSREKIGTFLRSVGAHRDSTGPIGKMLRKFHCIDSRDRLWGQPYFAIHPTLGASSL